jgi:hypothetical protein
LTLFERELHGAELNLEIALGILKEKYLFPDKSGLDAPGLGWARTCCLPHPHFLTCFDNDYVV